MFCPSSSAAWLHQTRGVRLLPEEGPSRSGREGKALGELWRCHCWGQGRGAPPPGRTGKAPTSLLGKSLHSAPDRTATSQEGCRVPTPHLAG